MIIDEINSGWGLICHLTIIISDKFNSKNNNSNQKYKTILNPDKKTVLEFSSDDKIIVIADDRDSSQ